MISLSQSEGVMVLWDVKWMRWNSPSLTWLYLAIYFYTIASNLYLLYESSFFASWDPFTSNLCIYDYVNVTVGHTTCCLSLLGKSLHSLSDTDDLLLSALLDAVHNSSTPAICHCQFFTLLTVQIFISLYHMDYSSMAGWTIAAQGKGQKFWFK